MKKLLYILSFSFSIVLFPNSLVQAQKTGFRRIGIGLDVSNYIIHAINRNLTEHEINAGISIHEKWDMIAEIGLADSDIEKYSYYYNVKGLFQRYGANFHILNEKTDYIYIGGRVGHSSFKRNITDAQIPDGFWSPAVVSFSENEINSFWLEGVIGLEVEVLKNIYLGWDLRIKAHLFSTKDDLMSVVYIPGYGNRNAKTGGGFSYTMSYKIPF